MGEHIARRGSEPTHCLEILICPDRDILVSVIEQGKDGRIINGVTMDVANPDEGGGQSPRTHKALLELAKAMEEDNNDPNLPAILKG